MTTLDLYTRRSDGEDRILEHLTLKMRLPTKKPGESPASDPLPSLDRIMPELELCWWAILGLNQWPLPCQGSALPLS